MSAVRGEHVPAMLALFPLRFYVMRLLLIAASVVLIAPQLAADTKRQAQGDIAVRLSGFESDDGQAICAIFKKDTWLQKGKGMPRKVAIHNRQATCFFKRVPFGTYAFAAFHDEDGDGEFDKRLGLPVEDYCFSNRAVPRRLRPPTFDAAKFAHESSRTNQDCKLR